ncbi:hypothetical protein PFICI_14716 [Pestalotiopsis fici W106-1]|uniref:Rhodopsin domain-containing protein n=1 Tax=Pestalotiopsis fici (strain W106-1 / CGMCC3.15140) TaxID=1229662 RepID=W3WIN1_PESFW|nr:uncharacterized protein PFICI_14716 [Pestalotiopsis fici W106-1]ETS73770.1 hypothetical protein PFICI_14716 [Pestalotiopsis fici W106-1]
MALVNGVLVAMPPPDGYIVDFDHPQRNSDVAAYWIFGVGNALSLLSILQRLYVRVFIMKKLQMDDAFLLVAYIFSVVLQCLIIRDFARGIMGTHIWEMPITKFYQFLKDLYQLPILYNPIQCGAKLSLLLVYQRLAPLKWYKLTVWTTAAIIVISSTVLLFITIFPCQPVQAAWDLTITDYQCVNRQAVYKAQAIMGAITDAMVLLVPIPVVVSLHIPRRQKFGLVCFFGIGAITVFTSIMRLIQLIKSFDTTDQTWGGGVVLLWIFAEANLSIICASLPTVKIFIRHVAPRLLGTEYAKRSYPAGNSTPNAMPTIGGTGEQKQGLSVDKYGWYEDGSAHPLDTIVDVEGGKHGQRRQESPDEQGTDGWDDLGDGGSERGIVQTRTTTVSYSK